MHADIEVQRLQAVVPDEPVAGGPVPDEPAPEAPVAGTLEDGIRET
jgi:hypothetical protein